MPCHDHPAAEPAARTEWGLVKEIGSISQTCTGIIGGGADVVPGPADA